jgi:hypothetical protein
MTMCHIVAMVANTSEVDWIVRGPHTSMYAAIMSDTKLVNAYIVIAVC